MALYVTMKCDGHMPPGSAERCRGGFSVQATIIDADEAGDVIDQSAVVYAAQDNGWTREFLPFDDDQHFCPDCTRHRREANA